MNTCLITGASSGLGIEFAQAMAERKYDLVLVARTVSRLESLAERLQNEFKIKCTVISEDLSTTIGPRRVFEEVQKRGLHVDVLINNAGFGLGGDFLEEDLHKISNMIDLNVRSLTEMTALFSKPMTERKSGYILNVASIASFMPGPWMAAYYATKAYVLSLTEALAVEYSKKGIQVTALCPGPTRTEFFDRAGIDMPPLTKLLMADAGKCARRGLDGMFDGDVIIVDGWKMTLIAISVKFYPRSWIRNIVGIMNKKR